MFILTNHIKPHKMRFQKHKTTLLNFFTEKENLAELCLLLLPHNGQYAAYLFVEWKHSHIKNGSYGYGGSF